MSRLAERWIDSGFPVGAVFAKRPSVRWFFKVVSKPSAGQIRIPLCQGSRASNRVLKRLPRLPASLLPLLFALRVRRMFARRASLRELALLSRSLGTMLHSGVAIHKALDMASRKVGGPRMRAVLSEATREVLSGSDVTAALRARKGYFPELFVDMLEVSEQSGAMPEVLKGLGEHYDNMLRLRRAFIGQITMPVVQLLMAIAIVAGLILILGMIGSARGTGRETCSAGD